jgi:hypothetical protein
VIGSFLLKTLQRLYINTGKILRQRSLIHIFRYMRFRLFTPEMSLRSDTALFFIRALKIL